MDKRFCIQPEKIHRMMLTIVCFRMFLYAAFGLVGISNAVAECKPDGPPLTQAMINDFLQKPEIILSDDANSKREANALRVSISQYAAASPAVIQALKSILPNATLQQRAAVGEGLYAAVIYCRASDSVIANRIESAVKSIGDKDVTHAYRLAASLSGLSTDISKPQTLMGLASAKHSARTPASIGVPTPTNRRSLDLKLSDPFRSLDAWR